ncbi:hypothetical protein EGR_05630 [Echinococcus granulosus]|uniref:Uncharacterized protein n=1 Tax=Echinococcus granulosus TaxID=6210 RepID=W6UDR4_ECHGR|nr:hypothetical protein EGR_05630 [Echinococcus granulosus]EUB59480.1 hypothetical protein EGR_05630 [Echinococcus granulosus]
MNCVPLALPPPWARGAIFKGPLGGAETEAFTWLDVSLLQRIDEALRFFLTRIMDSTSVLVGFIADIAITSDTNNYIKQIPGQDKTPDSLDWVGWISATSFQLQAGFVRRCFALQHRPRCDGQLTQMLRCSAIAPSPGGLAPRSCK